MTLVAKENSGNRATNHYTVGGRGLDIVVPRVVKKRRAEQVQTKSEPSQWSMGCLYRVAKAGVDIKCTPGYVHRVDKYAASSPSFP